MVFNKREDSHPIIDVLLKNGLFTRRFPLNLILRFCNWLHRNQNTNAKIQTAPKKILLSNIANFGDVVISTTVLPHIKALYPDAKVGFITSSTSNVVVSQHPLISKIHTFDHWYLYRHLGICKAVLHHFQTRRRLLKELKKEAYDLAIDLYSYFPNTIPLLAKSQIPVRIGYSTGGFSNLLTHTLKWNFHDRYVGHAHLQLLALLGIDIQKASPLPAYHYAKKSTASIVIHMGSSNPSKEWDKEKWIKLIYQLKQDGHEVLLTGKGEKERKTCSEVANQTSAIDLSDQLDWFSFVQKIQEARLLISVDSVPLHLAATTRTPTIALFTDTAPIVMWAPPGCHPMPITTNPSSVYEKALTLL